MVRRGERSESGVVLVIYVSLAWRRWTAALDPVVLVDLEILAVWVISQRCGRRIRERERESFILGKST